MAGVRGIINRVVGGGARRRSGAGPTTGAAGTTGAPGGRAGGRRGQDEAIGRGVRSIMGKLRR